MNNEEYKFINKSVLLEWGRTAETQTDGLLDGLSNVYCDP